MTTPEQLQNIRNCLDLLEHAQGIVNQAAGELCSVPGFADEWSSLSETYDAVKAAWYRVERRRCGLRERGTPCDASH